MHAGSQRGERRRLGLELDPPIGGDRHHRALLLVDHLDRPAPPVGDRVQRLDPDPPTHALGLGFVGSERDPWKHVAAGGLQEDALPAGLATHDVAHRAR